MNGQNMEPVDFAVYRLLCHCCLTVTNLLIHYETMTMKKSSRAVQITIIAGTHVLLIKLSEDAP